MTLMMVFSKSESLFPFKTLKLVYVEFSHERPVPDYVKSSFKIVVN